MTLLVVSSMGLVFSTIISLFGNIGRKKDIKTRRIDLISGKSAAFDEELETPFVERFFVPAFYSLLKILSRLIPKSNQKESSNVEKKLKLAGISMSTNEYLAAKFSVMLIIFGCALAMSFLLHSAPAKFFTFWLGALLAVAGPNYYLSARIKNRQILIRNQMPDVMDLLTVCVEAGLGFDAALIKISERFEGPLVDELMTVEREIRMALPRRDALKKFADRNNIPELKTFVGALIQADQMGLPIKNVLRIQSSQLRLMRKQVAEEKAMKAPVKMLLPLVFLVFPVVFIVLLGPTVIQLIKTFG